MVFFLLPVLIAVPILVAAVVFSLVLFVTPPAARPKSTLATSNSTLTVTVTGIGNIGGSKTVTAAYWGTPLPQSKSSSASSQPRFHSITKATVVFTEGVAKKELSSSTLSASPTSPSISPSTAPKAVTTTSIATHVTSAIAKVNSSSSSTDDRKHDQEEDDPKEPENRVSDDIGGLEDEFKDNHVKLHKKELHSDGSGFSGDDEGVGMNLEKRKINDATAEGM
ncbi:hypothetical protein EDD21DRAFT_89319 [Dissophora ornata]|nr:hypothetical protein EDD21DRAFT_89319 [Dissophora ornata]